MRPVLRLFCPQAFRAGLAPCHQPWRKSFVFLQALSSPTALWEFLVHKCRSWSQWYCRVINLPNTLPVSGECTFLTTLFLGVSIHSLKMIEKILHLYLQNLVHQILWWKDFGRWSLVSLLSKTLQNLPLSVCCCCQC